ncbi:MAG TPA: lysophospholipid acyltransferase family protein [Desulfatirhabdiaceae bacterium]|nr:lysophospholipid acyltransferase family protein [Desulfatirhabdiaceae bacterium]
MSETFYRITTAISQKIGTWFFRISAWFVATGYFLFFPSQVTISGRFYRVLYPGRSWFYILWCAWRQYHNFTTVFLDRFLLHGNGNLEHTSDGWDHLEKAIESKTGGIILMSHIGNWEVAAHLLKQKRPDIPLLLYMGIRDQEQIERIQKESLSHSGIRIITADQEGGSPFNIIEGIQFLRAGGLVSITGDVIWHPDQRAVSAEFLGHEVFLPETPHVLALMSGSPIFILITVRTGDRRYAFSVTEPYYVRAKLRSQRPSAIRASVQNYAARLAQMLGQHPLEWYHFRPFLGKKLFIPDDQSIHLP